jgi:hypothetical protein
MKSFHECVAKLFTYFHYKIYRSSSFKIDLSKGNQKKQVDTFLQLLANQYGLPSISPSFLIEYFVFQFSQKHDWATSMKIQLNWIIGKKAFDTWVNRNEHHSYFSGKFTQEYDINVYELKQQLFELELQEQGLDPAEELEKERFDGSARLFNCLQNTTLYNHKSPTCISCSERVHCKNFLLKQNKRLYEQRGYRREGQALRGAVSQRNKSSL